MHYDLGYSTWSRKPYNPELGQTPKGSSKMDTSDSYVLRVLFATPRAARGLEVAARRWRWLRTSLLDPYRPELYYMRGPGPKWRAKHTRR
jgi:hypothetical protein